MDSSNSFGKETQLPIEFLSIISNVETNNLFSYSYLHSNDHLLCRQRPASMNHHESRRIETKRKQVFPLLNRIALIAANKAISIFIMHTGWVYASRSLLERRNLD